MATDINRVFLIGRLTKAPELRYTQGGTSIASFSLANNRVYISKNERKESVSFFNCISWGKQGEVIAQHCKKGMRIGIEGRLQQRSWKDQNNQSHSTVEIVVETFQFLSPKPDEGTTPNTSVEVETTPSFDESFPADSAFDDEDIPF